MTDSFNLTFHHAKQDGTGTAMRIEGRPSTRDKMRGAWEFFLTLVPQQEGTQVQTARFEWKDKAITFKLTDLELSALIDFFSALLPEIGGQENQETRGMFFHQRKNQQGQVYGSTSLLGKVFFDEQTKRPNGWNLSLAYQSKIPQNNQPPQVNRLNFRVSLREASILRKVLPQVLFNHYLVERFAGSSNGAPTQGQDGYAHKPNQDETDMSVIDDSEYASMVS